MNVATIMKIDDEAAMKVFVKMRLAALFVWSNLDFKPPSATYAARPREDSKSD